MLVLVRHGESAANAAGLISGRTDAALTDKGRAQVRALRGEVATARVVISSPLRRALDTARGLGIDVPVTIDERWVELDYGTLDGCPVDEAPSDLWSRWKGDMEFRPGGGESLSELATRVRAACKELFGGDSRDADTENHDIVVVTHTSPIKAAVAWALGTGGDAVWRMHLSTGSVTRIDWVAGAPLLRCYNVVP